MPRIARNSRRTRTSCSVIAIATVLAVGASPAAAKSLNGTGSFFTNGAGAGIVHGATTTTVTLNGGQTVIDWLPDDNAINPGVNIGFQAAGTTALFQSGSNFQVLNRINPQDLSRAIEMNGLVQSRVGGAQNGSVYFYSPSGFIFGGTSVFSVGSLVVTALPIPLIAGNNFIANPGTDNIVVFGQAQNASATIVSGGSIDAKIPAAGTGSAGDSYVALVAPRVVHNGNISVNGSAALVAAEAATISFSTDGLFDIQVTTGTSKADAMSIAGGITGPASSSSVDDKQRIFAVAVPKNQAMTMLISAGSQLGFDIAGAANVDGNAVVLSAGYNVVDGVIQSGAPVGSTGTADLTVYDTDFTSRVDAAATNLGLFVADNTTANMASNLTLRAANTQFTAVSGGVHDVVGSVTLTSTNLGSGAGAHGGQAFVVANGGTTHIAGDLIINSQGIGGSGVSGTGGSVFITANQSGSLDVDGLFRINAEGLGGNGAAGTGGDVHIFAGTGSAITAHFLNVSADGRGGADSGLGSGSGAGGTADMRASGNGASISIANVVTSGTSDQRDLMSAEGFGGMTNGGGSGIGGTGTGGTLSVTAESGGAIHLPEDGNLIGLLARGTGGRPNANGTTGGLGVGGTLNLTADGGTLTAGTVHASAYGRGGDNVLFFDNSGNTNGGDGIGGQRHVRVLNGGTLTLSMPAGIAAGFGGLGTGTGNGGNGSGGLATLTVDNATANFTGRSIVPVQAGGGDALGTGAGGNATGGSAIVDIRNGGVVNVATDQSGSFDLIIGGTNFGGNANLGSNGGDATGGNVTVTIEGGSINGGRVMIGAEGDAGEGGGIGGEGRGGTATINLANSSITGTSTTVSALGTGGNGGTGGIGAGGTITLNSSANSTLGGSISLDANGAGGSGSSGNGGNGFGGDLTINATGGTLHFLSSLFASTTGTGGGADDGGVMSGNGLGGDLTIMASANATLDVEGPLSATADGFGGDIFGLNITGGNGQGGNVSLQAFGANARVTLGSSVDIRANGGTGFLCIECGGSGFGGNGTGGHVTVQAFGAPTSSMAIAGSLTVEANGRGGDGTTDSGDGTGGIVFIGANGAVGTEEEAGLHLHSDLNASANGDGGYSFGSGDGGQGTGGTVNVNTTGGGHLAIDGSGYIDAEGYGGGSGIIAFGDGGDGHGGIAVVQADGGSIAIGADLFATAEGVGGDSDNATGGDGFGRNAAIVATNLGAVTIGGNAILVASGTGGGGHDGGNGTGGGKFLVNTDGAHIFAQNGAITIGGLAAADSSGTGGDGTNGGDGGDGTGGYATIHAANSDAGPSSVTINGVESTAFVITDGHGGAGGSGTPGNTGGNGGAGGTGTGGFSGITAAAGNGHVDIGFASLSSQGFGGAGGDGGNGDGGAGGNGGVGGNAIGGEINVGTESGTAQAAGANLGVGDYGGIFADASATGGRGGDGNFGATNGNGGDGGDAFDGASVLLVRGSVVNVDSVTLVANATGGDAGFGYVPEVGTPGTTGVGGNATVGGDGGIAVLATNRNFPPPPPAPPPIQRGTLNAGSISGTAIATSGIGIPDGNSTSLGGSHVTFFNADGNIGSLDFLTQVGTNASATGNDPISVRSGTLVVGGEFSYVTPGNLSFLIDNGSFHAGTLNLSAGNFVHDPVNAPPVNLGTAFADNAIITTDGDFIADANWDVTNTFVVDAPGLIHVDNIHDDNGIDFSAGGTISISGLDAGTYVDLLAGGDIDTGNIHAGTSVREESTGGSIGVGNITAGGNVTLIAGTFIAGEDVITGGNIFAQTSSGDIDLENLMAGGGITLDSGHDIDLAGNLQAGGDAILSAVGRIDLNLVQAGFFHADAGTFFTSNDITSDSNIQINSGDDVTLGDLIAGTTADISNKAIRIISGGGVQVGDINSLGGIDITAAESVNGGNVTTGDGLFTDAVGAIHYGNISAGLVNPQPPTETFSVGLAAGTSINVGTVDAALGAAFISPGTVSTGAINAGTDILGLAHGAINLGNLDAGGRVLLADYSMFTDAGGTIPTSDGVDPETIFATAPVPTGSSITVGNVSAGSFTAAAGTNLTTGTINTDGGIDLHGGGAILTGDITAGDFVLANGGSITLGNVDAGSLTLTSTAGNITTGDVFAFGGVDLDAFGDILAGDITAGTIDLFAGDDITTGNLTTQQLLLFGGNDGITIQLFPGASITLEAGGDIATDNIDSIDGVFANAGGNISTDAIDAVDFVEMFADGTINTLAINAGDYVRLSSGGSIGTGNVSAGDFIDILSDANITTLVLNAGGDINLEALGNITFGNSTSGGVFDFDADGNVNGGNILATERISGSAGGAVVLGNLTAGPAIPVDDFSIGIAAAGNITAGNVSGAGHVGFATIGNLTTGSLGGGDLVMTLVGGNTTTGSITTTAPGTQVYMADDSMFITGGGAINGGGDFNPNIVLALDPVPTGGSITINGPVSTGLFRAAAGTGLTTQAITASNIEARAGGTATINGVWTVGNDSRLDSNNIDIAGTGGIHAGGVVTLVSTNGTQALIGDGFTGSGYSLSNAEFGRVSGSQVQIVGRGNASAALDMLVGDLTVTGPQAGSNIESADGALIFAVGDVDTLTPSGVIRVVGDVNATGFGLGNAIEFYATRFELDAATGSVSIFSSGSTLGGELGLYADRIHVASGSTLDKLAANPTYTNYQQDLDKAPAVQRPEGVIRADTLWIESDNLQDILIQNTGTFATRAGFLFREAFVNDAFEVAGPAGSINLVVNGQVVGEGGTLTGVAARDALITEETDITPYTSNSTINGCPLTGECIIRPPPPPPVSNVVDNQIDLITNNPLGDSEFGNEDSIDDNQEGDEGANNPIAPPQPLFDTRPLIPNSDVNDPVSGTGNPALLGGDQCDEDDQSLCKKEDGQ